MRSNIDNDNLNKVLKTVRGSIKKAIFFSRRKHSL